MAAARKGRAKRRLKHKPGPRDTAAWLTFLAVAAGFESIGGMVLADRLSAIRAPSRFDWPTPAGSEFWIFAGAVLLLTVLLYLALGAWLLVARFVFTRAEVEHLLRLGKARTLDSRLARVLGPGR